MLAETDTVLLDLKVFDPTAHRALTCADNAPVLSCARYLSEKGIAVWLRRVIVPGLTDDEADLRATGEFLRSLSNLRHVEVLPYHSMGDPKWRALGLDYTLANTPSPTPAHLAHCASLLTPPDSRAAEPTLALNVPNAGNGHTQRWQ